MVLFTPFFAPLLPHNILFFMTCHVTHIRRQWEMRGKGQCACQGWQDGRRGGGVEVEESHWRGKRGNTSSLLLVCVIFPLYSSSLLIYHVILLSFKVYGEKWDKRKTSMDRNSRSDTILIYTSNQLRPSYSVPLGSQDLLHRLAVLLLQQRLNNMPRKKQNKENTG